MVAEIFIVERKIDFISTLGCYDNSTGDYRKAWVYRP